MAVTFDIVRWAAWAPGLTTPDAWRSWSRAPAVVTGDDTPPLPELPANDRRRLGRLARLAFHVAYEVCGEAHGLPLVFASRHGDAVRLHELMVDAARGAPLSPLGFAGSVHNGIASLYSIARRDPCNVTAVANGLFTPEAAVFEAVTLADEAVVVVYDSSPHAELAPTFPEPASDFAYAWRVRRGGGLRLRALPADATTPGPLPHALDVLRFALSDSPRLWVSDGVSGYEWARAG